VRDGSEVECGCGCGDDAGARALESDSSNCSTSCHVVLFCATRGKLQVDERADESNSPSFRFAASLLPRTPATLYARMQSDDRAYHQAKIAFVSDLEGGSVSHINLVCATALVRPHSPPFGYTLAPPR
jgi:hypothetical protein